MEISKKKSNDRFGNLLIKIAIYLGIEIEVYVLVCRRKYDYENKCIRYGYFSNIMITISI